MKTKGAIYTWGLGPDHEKKPGFVWLLGIMNRFQLDTVVDLRRASSGLAKDPDPNAVGALYALARGGRRILLVCSHPDPRHCHRHAALALPIAQDAVNYAAARKRGPLMALPISPIDVKHVIGDLLVDPVEYEEAVTKRRKPKGKRWR
jgi:hypothetical protein